MDKVQNGTIKLLVDTPEQNLLFGFEGYASILSSAVMGTDPHFTIGILGSWGCGKTTLLKRIETNLKTKYAKKVVTVYFDAWRYQHEERMIIALLNTLSDVLKETKIAQWQTVGTNFRDLAQSIVTSAKIKTPFVEFDGGKAIKNLKEQEDKSRSIYRDWLNDLQNSVATARKDDPQKRIVIFIDDLDRCLPYKVIDILESIKVFLDINGIVFILALDQQIVEKSVEIYYGEKYSSQGKNYLKKLIQVEFRLPPLRRQDVIDYTNTLVKTFSLEDKEAANILSELVPDVTGGNPREVKRFINSIVLGTAIMRGAGITIPSRLQIAFMTMDFRWSGIMQKMLYQDVVNHLDAYFGNTGTFAQLHKDQNAVIKAVLQDNPGLEVFLKSSIGKELCDLTSEKLSQLLFYASMTKEKNTADYVADVIDDVLATLTHTEQRIIRLYFGLEDGKARTIKELCAEWAVEPQIMKNWKDDAVRKLHHPSRSKLLNQVAQISWEELTPPYQKLLEAVFEPDWKNYP